MLLAAAARGKRQQRVLARCSLPQHPPSRVAFGAGEKIRLEGMWAQSEVHFFCNGRCIAKEPLWIQ